MEVCCEVGVVCVWTNEYGETNAEQQTPKDDDIGRLLSAPHKIRPRIIKLKLTTSIV